MALNSNTFHDMISNIDYSKLKKAPRKEEEETDEKDWTGVRKLFNSDYFKDGLNKAYNPNVKKVNMMICPEAPYGMRGPGAFSEGGGGGGGNPAIGGLNGMMGGVYPGAGSGYINPSFAGAAAKALTGATIGSAVGSAIINGAVNNATNNSKDYNKLGPDGYTPGESKRLFPEATPTRPTRTTIPGTEVKTPNTSIPQEEKKKNDTTAIPNDLGLEPDEDQTEKMPEKERTLEDDTYVTRWLEKSIDDYINYYETEDSALAAVERSLDYLKKREEYAVNDEDPNDPKRDDESREERIRRRRWEFREKVEKAFRKRYRQRDEELNGEARRAEQAAKEAEANSKLNKPGESIDAERRKILKNRKPQHRMSDTESSRTDYDHAMSRHNANEWSVSK